MAVICRPLHDPAALLRAQRSSALRRPAEMAVKIEDAR